MVHWVPCPCFPFFNHYFYKKLNLYIHIPNIYLGLDLNLCRKELEILPSCVRSPWLDKSYAKKIKRVDSPSFWTEIIFEDALILREKRWFLPKNQHTQKKLLSFENWCNGEVSKIWHHIRKWSYLKTDAIKKCQ